MCIGLLHGGPRLFWSRWVMETKGKIQNTVLLSILFCNSVKIIIYLLSAYIHICKSSAWIHVDLSVCVYLSKHLYSFSLNAKATYEFISDTSELTGSPLFHFVTFFPLSYFTYFFSQTKDATKQMKKMLIWFFGVFFFCCWHLLSLLFYFSVNFYVAVLNIFHGAMLYNCKNAFKLTTCQTLYYC